MAKARPNSMLKFICICLFLNAFTLILSRDITYDSNTRSAEAKIQEAYVDEIFTLKFTYQEDKPAYIKVILTPSEGQTTPNLCYSPTDSSCDKNRVIHATRADKSPVFACMRKAEFSDDKNINVKVSCRTEKCGYTIKFEGNDRCRLDSDKGSVYSYVVTSDNKKMEFEIFGKSKLETYMQIGLEGSTEAKVNIYGDHPNSKSIVYDGAQFYSYQVNIDAVNETQSLGEFSVENGAIGDLIRLTVYSMYDAKGPDNLLYPGGSAVMGLVSVNEHFMPELCLPVSAFETGEYAEMSKFYLTGKIYSQYALFWPANERGEYVEDIEQEVNDGLLAYMLEPKGKKSSICFEYSYVEQVEHRDVVFSVQIIPMATKNTNNFYFMPPPMTVGQSYRHVIQKGKTLAYTASKLDISKKRYSLNIFKRKGEVRVLATNCETYPKCEYNMDDGGDEVLAMESVPFVGKISLYDRKMEKSQEALDKTKKVFVITCLDDGNDKQGYCEFDTYFNYEDQKITLVNGETMAKYVEKGKKGQFQIFFNGALRLENVAVEIMVHNGEILFEGKTIEKGLFGEVSEIDKYILSNKVLIFYRLYREKTEYLFVEYEAIKDSFFTIKYLYNKAGMSEQYKNETIFPGESYLVEMDPNADYKTVHVINDKNKDGNGFLTNFFSLNCDFKVSTIRDQGKEEEVALADGYGQDILSKDSGLIYNKEIYNYTITIETPEKSNYNKKMCMMYVAGTKVDDPILIGNNVNQQIIFEDNFKVVKFIYPLPDYQIDLVVYANIIDKAYYNIAIAVDNAKHTFFNEKITKSTPFYIKSSDFNGNCTKDTFCNILIVVEMVKSIDYLPQTNPMIEITVREATQKKTSQDYLRVPTYLQKGIAKKDFTTGDGYYYLYTDLGVSDEGDVTINFYRDYGEVYGRIVKKNVKDSEGDDIEWMNLYRLPGEGWGDDDKNFNKYLKKYHIDIEDTADCINGCYLILGIIISQIGEYAEDWKFYPFSIVTQISQSTFGEAAEVPIITIQVDEFIIGNVDVAKNVRINQYYQVWLPRDSYQVQFDWQSELAGLYVNVDGNLPTATNADFILRPNKTDSILTIDQQAIIEYAKAKREKLPVENSIEDVRLIIGVWTDKTDSADTELYSLRVHEASLDPKEYTFFDIIEVNTDQKVLCKPYIIGENRYQCLFMIIYDRQDLEFEQDILVYARSNNRGDSTEMYASFIDNNIYDDFMIDNLKASIPSYDQSDYNSVKQDTNYFHVKLNSEPKHKDRYLYVSVISRYQDDIMMVASINTYDRNEKTNVQIFYPSPRTEQLVQAKEDTLVVQFMADTSLIVNIENLGGEADVRWEEDDQVVHNLRGRGDRLTLTSSTNYKRIIFKKLKSDAPQRDNIDPGFVFIIDYYSRSATKNFDEVVYGNSIEIGYRDTDLPIFLYSKSVDYTNDIALSVTFRDSHIDTSGEYKESPIFVKAFLDKRDSVYAAKQLPIFEPSEQNKIDGIYDPAIKTAQVFMPDYMINSYMKIEPEDYPTLLLYVGKNPNYKDKQYKTFNVEAQFSRINSLVVPVEKIYNYGKFEGLKTHYYKLKTHRVKKIMKVVLSFNSEELSWAIGDKQSAHTNVTNTRYHIEASKRNGKILATIQPVSGEEPLDFLYLNIWKTKPNENENFQIQNYVFKYINVEKESEFFDYEIFGDKPDLTINEDKNGDKTTITCKFNRINIPNNEANITYFLKIADAKYYIDRENWETIAITETPYYTKYERNPQTKSNQVTLSATGDFSNWGHIQVIAQIQQNKVLEYIAYKGVSMKRETPSDDDGNGGSSTGLFVGISVTLVILIAGLVVLVIYFQRRNKSLVNQVKHVSFQQNTSAASDPDLLLAKK